MTPFLLLMLTCIGLLNPVISKDSSVKIVLPNQVKLTFTPGFHVKNVSMPGGETTVDARYQRNESHINWDINLRPDNKQVEVLSEEATRLSNDFLKKNPRGLGSISSISKRKFANQDAILNIYTLKVSADDSLVVSDLIFDHGSDRWYVNLIFYKKTKNLSDLLILARKEITKLEKNWKWIDNKKQ